MSLFLSAEIREPLEEFLFQLPYRPPAWWIVLGGIALIAFVVMRARYRRDGEVAAEAVLWSKDLSPHLAALASLQELDGHWPDTVSEFDTFHVAVSHVVRRYVHHRYEVPALELATDELIDSCNERDLPAGQIDSLRALLRKCDLVKFAEAFRREGARNPRDGASSLLASARDYVNATAVEEGEEG